MLNLLKISIVFENCDSITLDKNQIYNFHADGITETIGLISNSILFYKIAKKVRLSIRMDMIPDTIEGQSLLNRLKTKDITSYYLFLNNNTEYKLIVPWKGKNQYKNKGEYHIIEKNILSIEHY